MKVVVSPDGDEYKCCLRQRPPLVAGATTFPPAKAVGLWTLGSGVNLYLWQQWRENHTTGLHPEENRQTALRAWKCTPSAACGGVFPGGADSSGAMH